MHLLFIFPKWKKLTEGHPELNREPGSAHIGSFKMAGIGIPTAVAALPSGHQVTLHDENLHPVDCSIRPDLVAISFFTPQAARAYAIADEFVAQGVPVIGGGIHPTMAPEDTLRHFTSIVRGPVENLWPEILGDRARGQLKRIYVGQMDAPFVQPQREVFSDSTYLKAGIVQTARGCPLGCRFCVVPGCYGEPIQFKPIDAVLEDIRCLPYGCYFFADENLLFADATNRSYRCELLSRINEAGIWKIFFLAAYPFMVRELSGEDIQLLRQAGCRQLYLILGLRDPLKEELRDDTLRRKVTEMRAAGIEMFSTFTLGHDEDPPDVDAAILEFCDQIKTNLAEFTLHTPFPGTPMFVEFEKAGRLLTRDWDQYNGGNVVFQPRHESPESLQRRYVSLWKTFYGRLSPFSQNQRYAKGFGREIFRNETIA